MTAPTDDGRVIPGRTGDLFTYRDEQGRDATVRYETPHPHACRRFHWFTRMRDNLRIMLHESSVTLLARAPISGAIPQPTTI